MSCASRGKPRLNTPGFLFATVTMYVTRARRNWTGRCATAAVNPPRSARACFLDYFTNMLNIISKGMDLPTVEKW